MATPKEQWADILARLRHERSQYVARATARRKDGLAARKRRDWIASLQAADRETEYRATVRQLTSEIEKIKHQWGLR